MDGSTEANLSRKRNIMDYLKTMAIGAIAVTIIITIAIGGRFINLKSNQYFAPKEEKVRREVYEQTRSFNESKLQELTKYRLEYMRAENEDEKQAIAATVRLTFAAYDKTKLPYELQIFIEECNK